MYKNAVVTFIDIYVKKKKKKSYVMYMIINLI